MLVLKKIDMAKNRKIVIPIIAGIIIFLILFFVVLAPTRKEIAGKNKKWRELKTQLVAARSKLENFKVDKPTIEAKVEELRRRLPSKSPTSMILEELTKKGKQLNIEFVSIAPQQLQQDIVAESECKVVPININMKATYRDLGEYLGLVENLESSFATVKGFEATKDERTFPKLTVNMRIYTYVLEEGQGGQK